MSGKPKQQQKHDDAVHEKDDKANFYASEKVSTSSYVVCRVVGRLSTRTVFSIAKISHHKKREENSTERFAMEK